jgi:hypothetical protein
VPRLDGDTQISERAVSEAAARVRGQHLLRGQILTAADGSEAVEEDQQLLGPVHNGVVGSVNYRI